MKARKEATKRAAVAALGLTLAVTLFLSLARCTVDELKNIPTHADTLAYEELMETIRQLEGDSAAQVFAETKVEEILIDTVRVELSGVENGNPNTVQLALAQLLCYGLRHGMTGSISGMTAEVFIIITTPKDYLNMSPPQRTAGGRGSFPYITVNSTKTFTEGNSGTWRGTYLYSGISKICSQVHSNQIADGDTLNVNWTINIGGNYYVTQRSQLAKVLSPESGYGGSMYPVGKCKVKLSSGDVLLAPYAMYGGSGNDTVLVVEYRYTHSGSSATINSFEIQNSNGDVIHVSNDNKPVSDGSIVKIFHKADFTIGNSG